MFLAILFERFSFRLSNGVWLFLLRFVVYRWAFRGQQSLFGRNVDPLGRILGGGGGGGGGRRKDRPLTVIGDMRLGWRVRRIVDGSKLKVRRRYFLGKEELGCLTLVLVVPWGVRD